MAHKKAGGSTALGRDSRPKYLGVKLHDGERAHPGMVIVRQRGTPIHAGRGVGRGKDDTLFARAVGVVRFSRRSIRNFNGKIRTRVFASIASV